MYIVNRSLQKKYLIFLSMISFYSDTMKKRSVKIPITPTHEVVAWAERRDCREKKMD